MEGSGWGCCTLPECGSGARRQSPVRAESALPLYVSAELNMCGENRRRTLLFTRDMQDWLTIAWMCMVMVSGEAETLVPRSARAAGAEVIHIFALPDKPNFLTIGPIITQPTSYLDLRELLTSNVSSIGPHSFWGLHNLRLINLTRNLTSIGADNFRGHINLTDLHLERNYIEQMSSSYGRMNLVLANN